MASMSSTYTANKYEYLAEYVVSTETCMITVSGMQHKWSIYQTIPLAAAKH